MKCPSFLFELAAVYFQRKAGLFFTQSADFRSLSLCEITPPQTADASKNIKKANVQFGVEESLPCSRTKGDCFDRAQPGAAPGCLTRRNNTAGTLSCEPV